MLEELCRQFRLLEDDGLKFHFLDSPFPVYKGRNKLMLMLEHLRQQCWKQLLLPVKAWQKKCDIVFCNDYFAPYIHLGFHTVQVYHDAFFYEYAEHYNAIWLQMFKHLAVPAARRSAFIVAPSRYARDTIHRHTQIPLEKIVPIYEGPKTFPPSSNNEPVPGWLAALKNKRYILHVGVFEKRKNLPRLIQAFCLLKERFPDLQLVLVGKGSGKPYSEDLYNIQAIIKEKKLENEVLMPGYLPDAVLNLVYRHAFMYVFPSVNEGFGIPLLEAFRAGLPVLASNNTCLPEVGGDAILTFNPFDETDIYHKMLQVLEDATLRATLCERGQKRLQLFSWETTAKQIISLFEKAVSRPKN